MTIRRKKKVGSTRAGRKSGGTASKSKTKKKTKPKKKIKGTNAASRGKKKPARKKRLQKRANGNSALGKIQPDLERALLSLLGRRRQQLSKLPATAQLKLLEVESGGFTYTLNRLRPPAEDSLTHRQKQIARQVSLGLSNKEIGEKLEISSATVAAHLRTIFTKLRVKTRTALAKHALAYYS